MALLHFTSGTTGTPKGAVHVHEAVVAHHATGRYALDLHPDDIFWCTADPGWVTGTSYGIIAPLVHGVTERRRRGGVRRRPLVPDPRRAAGHRLVHRADRAPHADAGRRRARRRPRPVGAAVRRQRRRAAQPRGRRLGPGGVRPARPRQLVADRDRRDHDRQLRRRWTSGPARWAARCPASRPPSSPATPTASRWCATARRCSSPSRTPRASSRCGPGWPSMFRGYLTRRSATGSCFAGGWYLTGDLARRDADGYYWFVGRGDDVIKSAGHLIGPFEVESVAHGAPRRRRGRRDRRARPGRRRGRQGLRRAAARLRAVRGAAPRAHRLRPQAARRRRRAAARSSSPTALPKTRSGKIMRRLLQARELGLPEGDTLDAGGGDGDRGARRQRPSRATREHVRHLLRQMLRIRRFEERCVELYSAAKIRGFLHLYIGEEAVAAGVMAALGAGRRRRRHLPRARPRAAPRRRRRARSWPRCTARSRAAAAAAAARCTSSTPPPASTAATRSSAAACRSPSGWRWPTRCRAATG